MAKVRTAQRSKTLSPRKQAGEVLLPSFSVEHFGLLSTAFQSKAPSEETSSEKNTIDCIATLLSTGSDKSAIAMVVEIRTYRDSGEHGTGFVAAAYLSEIKSAQISDASSIELRQQLAEIYIKVSLWQNYRGLFSQINSQSIMEFKPLPPTMLKVRWLTNKQFEDQIIKIPLIKVKHEDGPLRTRKKASKKAPGEDGQSNS